MNAAKTPADDHLPRLALVGGSIVEFLSDGSLAALAGELGGLFHERIELRDERDRLIAHLGDGSIRWKIDEDADAPPDNAWRAPIVASERVIGSLVVHDTEPPPHAKRILRWIARVAGEFCTVELDLRHRLREVELMYSLSALLIRAADPGEVLSTALDLVLDAMDLDAGNVVLLSEQSPSAIHGDERAIRTMASRGLSEAWVRDATPLSRDREFDRLAIAGEVVAIENLSSDPRVLEPQRLGEQGLVSFISAGLAFRGRPIGVYRLYSKTPRHFTSAERALLRSVAEHSAIAIEQSHLLKVQEAEADVRRQLQLAEDVQRRMLPASLPDVPRLDLAARYQPSERLAGDFYDVFESDDRFTLVVGDVVGHGVAAALIMASVRSTLRAVGSDDRPLCEVVSLVNKAMCRDTLQSEFCTLFTARFDPRSLELSYCNAGHSPPLLLRTDGASERLQPGGMLIGIEPEADFTESRTILSPGDLLVAFTDGLVDTMAFSGERFGIERLIDSVRASMENARPTGAGVVERVFWELRQFAGLHERTDDVTLLVAQVRES